MPRPSPALRSSLATTPPRVQSLSPQPGPQTQHVPQTVSPGPYIQTAPQPAPQANTPALTAQSSFNAPSPPIVAPSHQGYQKLVDAEASPLQPRKPIRNNTAPPQPATSFVATLRNANELAKKLAVMGTHTGSSTTAPISSLDTSRANSDDEIVEEQDGSVPLFTLVRKRAQLTYKSEKGSGKWKTIYVELLPKMLILYKNQGRKKPERKDKEVVLIKFDLKKMKVDPNPAQSDKKKNCIGVSDATRNVVLQFSSDAETSEWMAAFREGDISGSNEALSLLQRKTRSNENSDNAEKQNIRQKLMNFFKSRPTVDKLKEKGVIPQDLVFGGLLDLQCRKEGRQVPLMLQHWTDRIEKLGLDIVGIYRLSGNASTIQKLRLVYNQSESANLDDEEWSDINLISGILKLYFRELQIPLFTFVKYDSFLNAVKIDDYNEKMYALREALHSLPPTHFQTLKHLMNHLRKVASHSSVNKMEPSNLAIVFGPTLLRPEEESIHTIMNMGFQNGVVELLIEQCEWFFN